MAESTPKAWTPTKSVQRADPCEGAEACGNDTVGRSSKTRLDGASSGGPSLMKSAMKEAVSCGPPANGGTQSFASTCLSECSIGRTISAVGRTETEALDHRMIEDFPPPYPVSQPSIDRRPASKKSVYSIGTRLRIQVNQLKEDLEHITGDPGDVDFDDGAGYGQAALTFQDVSFSVAEHGQKRQILAPVSGHFEPGTLVALMGPSGCGKTTLLDILADKKTSHYEGTVHLNGRPRDKLFNRVTSYIPQADIMPAHLTVYEVIVFYQALKVERPKKMSNANARYFLEERLKLLGLYEVKDTKIGNETVRGISGGQRRRVSLACGLSSMAQIFFADEPTSGLSGTDAEACIRYMRLLAKKLGLTLVVSIHQPRPEVSKLFDHLLLLTAKPGRAVYNGPMRDAANFLEKVGYSVPEFANPTDWFLDLVTPDIRGGQPALFIDRYENQFRQSVDGLVQKELSNERKTALELIEELHQVMEEYGEMPAVRNSVYGVRFHRQLELVFTRQVRLSMRDPLGISMELGVAVAQSIVIGIAYLQVGKQPNYNQALFFFMLIMTVAIVGMKVMPKLIDERLVVKKETSEALYNDWAYILSFSSINTVVGILGNAIFVVLVFWMSSCNWELLPEMLFWNTLLYLVMDSVYTMIAAIAVDATNAVTLALPFLTLFLLYNNFTVYRDILPEYMKWLLRLSPVAYVMEAVTLAADRIEPDFFQPIINEFGYRDEIGLALCMLVLLWVIFRIAAVICFKKLNNIRR